MLAISVDDLHNARQMQQLTGVSFPVLADPGHAAASAYGVFNLLGDGVAAPAAFVVTADGARGYIGQDIADRVPAAVILDLLRDLNGAPQGTSS